mgnify:CR=1 FL=1
MGNASESRERKRYDVLNRREESGMERERERKERMEEERGVGGKREMKIEERQEARVVPGEGE